MVTGIELLAIEMTLGMVCVLFGWLHLRQNRLEEKLEHCVNKDDLNEIKQDLKTTLELLTEVRVENAKWQGLMQRALEIE
jgi:hypothetical protein